MNPPTKPCPFCGSANTRISCWLDIGKSCAVCLGCEAIAVYTSGNQEDCGFAETARRWNLRPPEAERLAKALAILASHHCADGCEVERFLEGRE